MKKKQTSVEWLIEQLKEYDFTYVQDNENYVIVIPVSILAEKLEQAKAMHKEEIISFGYKCTGAMESELGDIIYNKLPEDIYNDTLQYD